MNINLWSGKSNFLFALLVIVAFGACKKSKVAPDPEPSSAGAHTKQTSTSNRIELTNDSLFLYAKEVYYWNDALPAYDDFEPRKYGSNYTKELFEITRFKLNPSTGLPYEYRSSDPSKPKYSFIEDITNQNPVAVVRDEKSSVDLEGNGNDVGIFAVRAIINSNVSSTYKLRILAVDQGSPAALAGLTRGAYITKINGIQTSIVANFDRTDRALINSTIYGNPNSMSLEGYKIDGTPFVTTLTKRSYKSNPVFKTNVLTVGGKKIGYLSYARFSNEGNSFSVLENAFNDYAGSGVTDLVVDLRYNGGGYVNTAEYLVNLIAPLNTTGVMYKEYYNTTLQTRNAKIMKNQPLLDENGKIRYQNGKMLNGYDNTDYSVAGNTYSFSKKGNLNGVTNVVFIVSGNTASASELVINSLKAKINVKLVGEKTYGKPIGFFPVRIENKYDVYFSMFETKNALDQGGYFSGMTPDVAVADSDYGEEDFGDPSEPLLAAAIGALTNKPIATGVVSRNKVMSVSTSNLGTNSILGKFDQNKEFLGMIENRVK